MKCPICGCENNHVVDSRSLTKENGIRRRRECEKCKNRFTTYEYVTLSNALVIKNNGSREEFSREKVLKSIKIACVKRPVTLDNMNNAIKQIENRIASENRSEIPSKQIGEWVIGALKELDKVAYIRYASVYHDFENITEFNQRIADLENS